jgi:putative transposase
VARKKHTLEQIIQKLREAETALAQGQLIGAVCRKLEVTEQTYYRFRKEYGRLKLDQARRLKDLEKENGRLKKLVVDQALEIFILREVAQGSF